MADVSSLRRLARRLLEPWRGRHHGYLFVARRVWRNRRRGWASTGTVVVPCPTVAVAELDPATTVVHEVHAQELIEITHPVDLDPWLRDAPGWHLRHGVPPQWVVELRGGEVLGDEGWIGTADGRIAVDFNDGIVHPGDAPCSAAVAARARGTVDLPGTTASLVVLGAGNYYHWMLQALPMLGLISDAVGLDAVDRFLIDPFARPFVHETLARAGIDGDRVRVLDAEPPALRAETLVAATTLLHHLPPPTWATDFVRGLFASELASGGAPAGGGGLYYLRREGEGRNRRRILNENALVAALAPLGFESVAMEGRTVAAQAELFAGARCIVAAHGAGLTNLVFCRPGTRVVEVLPANALVAIYAQLSYRLGLDHHAVVGTEARPPRRWRTFIGDADVVADVDRIVGNVAPLAVGR